MCHFPFFNERIDIMDRRACELLEKKGLKVIYSDTQDIGKRINAYDKDLILTYNPKQNEYQVYDVQNYPIVMIATFASVLDARLIERVKRADNRTSYGIRAKVDEVRNEQMKKEADEKKSAYEIAQAMKKELKGADKGLKHFI